ncbi:MAG: hypothetical protein ORO03_06060, partial [Alphaproteobacteria bacterium]|nr:hypothetical protein [Alphaproteobacteria bacterium]
MGGVPPFIGATVALLKEEKVPIRYWLGGSVVWLALAMVQRFAQAVHKDRKQAAYESAADLTGCLHVLVGILRAKLKIPDTEMDPLTAGAG